MNFIIHVHQIFFSTSSGVFQCWDKPSNPLPTPHLPIISNEQYWSKGTSTVPSVLFTITRRHCSFIAHGCMIMSFLGMRSDHCSAIYDFIMGLLRNCQELVMLNVHAFIAVNFLCVFKTWIISWKSIRIGIEMGKWRNTHENYYSLR